MIKFLKKQKKNECSIFIYYEVLKLEKDKKKIDEKKAGEESQFEIQAVKQWEQNGRQVGQLWMLSENMLKKQCIQFSLETKGAKHELIANLAKYLRSKERLMITDGKLCLHIKIWF